MSIPNLGAASTFASTFPRVDFRMAHSSVAGWRRPFLGTVHAEECAVSFSTTMGTRPRRGARSEEERDEDKDPTDRRDHHRLRVQIPVLPTPLWRRRGGS